MSNTMKPLTHRSILVPKDPKSIAHPEKLNNKDLTAITLCKVIGDRVPFLQVPNLTGKNTEVTCGECLDWIRRLDDGNH